MALAILEDHCMSQGQALVIQEKQWPISSPVSALAPVSFPPERFGPYPSCNLHGESHAVEVLSKGGLALVHGTMVPSPCI